jgi:twinkle protein
LERDQQDASGAGTVVRILKNRFSGWTGVAGHVKYDEKTGRMVTLDDTPSFVEKKNDFAESDF